MWRWRMDTGNEDGRQQGNICWVFVSDQSNGHSLLSSNKFPSCFANLLIILNSSTYMKYFFVKFGKIFDWLEHYWMGGGGGGGYFKTV